jgi:hypothetical protein
VSAGEPEAPARTPAPSPYADEGEHDDRADSYALALAGIRLSPKKVKFTFFA